MNEVKESVAFVVFSPDRSKVLSVKRAPDDESLPGAWGLPAGSLRAGETPEQATLRAGKEKLGVGLEIVRLISQGTAERNNYSLHMREFEARITDGTPTAPQPHNTISQYTAWKWVTPESLKPAATQGSLCSRLFLSELGLGWQDI